MKKFATTCPVIFRTVFLFTSLAFVPAAYGQEASNGPGKTDYFIKQLTPPATLSYANPEYRKKIVRLKWYDGNRPQTAIVNLSKTFDIYGLFAGNSSLLSPRAKAVLDDLGQAITAAGINTRMYALAAHTDATGRNSTSQALTTRRAKAVKAYLLDNFDIAGNRLRTVGFGAYNLKDKKNPDSGKNNRVEVCLIEDIYNHAPGATVQLPKNSDATGQIMTSSAKKKTTGKKKQAAKEKTRRMTKRHGLKKHTMKRAGKSMAYKKMAHKKQVKRAGQEYSGHTPKKMMPRDTYAKRKQKNYYSSRYEEYPPVRTAQDPTDHPTYRKGRSYRPSPYNREKGYRSYSNNDRTGYGRYTGYDSYSDYSSYGGESCKR